MPVQSPIRENSQLSTMSAQPAASSRSLVDCLPLKLVLYLAAPYLAGKSAQDAFDTAQRIFKKDRFCGTLDILGEDATCIEDCDAAESMYIDLVNEVVRNRLATDIEREQLTISMKPSMFSPIAPGAGPSCEKELSDAKGRIARVVDYAFRKNVRVTLEAEDYRWTDFHLDTYFSLFNAGYRNLGTVLQTRLYRTEQDIKRFGAGTRVRMVIGIYPESPNIAHTDKTKMKELLVKYSGELLSKGVYVEAATHDSLTIEDLFREVILPYRVPSTQFELQFLLGVPRMQLQRALVHGGYFRAFATNFDKRTEDYLLTLVQSGVLVRMYLPYGKDSVAGPYCRRRLMRNPNMIGYGIKNLLRLES
jgi:proline dehydrogenase